MKKGKKKKKKIETKKQIGEGSMPVVRKGPVPGEQRANLTNV